MRYNLAALQNLVDQFERMQGIGHKTAQRMAFYVLGLSDEETRAFTDAITEAHTIRCRNMERKNHLPKATS